MAACLSSPGAAGVGIIGCSAAPSGLDDVTPGHSWLVQGETQAMAQTSPIQFFNDETETGVCWSRDTDDRILQTPASSCHSQDLAGHQFVR